MWLLRPQWGLSVSLHRTVIRIKWVHASAGSCESLYGNEDHVSPCTIIRIMWVLYQKWGPCESLHCNQNHASPCTAWVPCESLHKNLYHEFLKTQYEAPDVSPSAVIRTMRVFVLSSRPCKSLFCNQDPVNPCLISGSCEAKYFNQDL